MGTGATLLTPIAAKKGPRTFWVRLPVTYDPNKKYRTVYLGQGCGGYDESNTSTYQLYRSDGNMGGTDEAIYVALDIPTDMANETCYDNRDGPSSQEWEAFELIHTMVDSNFCVDNDRVYATGYSTGGWLQNMWGCYFAGDGLHPWNGTPGTISSLTSRANSVSDAGTGTSDGPMSMPEDAGSTVVDSGPAASDADMFPDGPLYLPTPGQRKFAPEYHVRAQAGVSGGEPDNNPPCNGPVAAFWLHDLLDPNAYSANHTDALDRVLRMNGCFSNNPPTAPWHEDVMGKGVCVEYTACPAAYPVVFCTTNMYGHGSQDARAIPGFNIFFNELESHMTATQ
jgi:poly(3-hydroxybutyrate) depolymerase